MPIRRPLTVAIALLVAGGALTACHQAGGPQSIDGCTPSIQPGGASNAVQRTTGEGASPSDVPFALPLAVNEAQASISGATSNPAEHGDVVIADYTLYDGTDGRILESTDSSLLAASSAAAGQAPGQPSQQLVLRTGGDQMLSQGLECATADSTVALVASYSELFGESVAQAGVDPASTAVLLLDVADAFPGRAEGMPQPAVGGMPSLALGTDGTPGITFPGTPAPEGLTVATTIQGSGREVAEGDQLVVQYTLIEWDATETTETTWGASPARFSLDDLIPGFQQAVIGEQVGSQVVAVVPPDLGYQDDRTLVFVIDILDAETP